MENLKKNINNFKSEKTDGTPKEQLIEEFKEEYKKIHLLYQEVYDKVVNKKGVMWWQSSVVEDFALDVLEVKFGEEVCKKNLYYHCLIGSTPPYNQITTKEDFDGEYSIKLFLEKLEEKMQELEGQQKEEPEAKES